MMPDLRAAIVAVALLTPLVLSGCGTMMVAGAVVGTTVTAGVIVTETAIGAGTLAVEGAGAVIRGTGSLVEAAVD